MRYGSAVSYYLFLADDVRIQIQIRRRDLICNPNPPSSDSITFLQTHEAGTSEPVNSEGGRVHRVLRLSGLHRA